MSVLSTCPCCGHRTLPDRPGAFELCPVCGWEDDGPLSDTDPTRWDGGPNGISLAEGQRRFRRYGSSTPTREWSRPPKADEERDPDWRPFDDPTANLFRDYVQDLTYLVIHNARRAVDEERDGGDERARGRLDAWRDAVALLVSQAEVFGLSPDDIGLPDGLDPNTDFSLDLPPGSYAG